MIIKTNKRIAIPQWNTGDNNFGITKPYQNFIESFGKLRTLTLDDDFDPSVDLLILPGGADMSPISYGQFPGAYTGNTDVYKQSFFEEKLPAYIKAGTPIFAICLGMQQLNIYFGGTLIQHLMFHPYSHNRQSNAHKVYSAEYLLKEGDLILPDEDEDDIDFIEEEEEMIIIDNGSFGVNSLHHQGVTIKTLSNKLKPLLVARNEDDDRGLTNNGLIVEAFKHKKLPIVGVQFHPEETFNLYTVDILNDLLVK